VKLNGASMLEHQRTKRDVIFQALRKLYARWLFGSAALPASHWMPLTNPPISWASPS